jgi:hypothetical protein
MPISAQIRILSRFFWVSLIPLYKPVGTEPDPTREPSKRQVPE